MTRFVGDSSGSPRGGLDRLLGTARRGRPALASWAVPATRRSAGQRVTPACGLEATQTLRPIRASVSLRSTSGLPWEPLNVEGAERGCR
jgi:hypothetical protein